MKLAIVIIMLILFSFCAFGEQFTNQSVLGTEAPASDGTSSFWDNIVNAGKGFISWLSDNPFIQGLHAATVKPLEAFGISFDFDSAAIQKGNAGKKSQFLTEEQIHDLRAAAITDQTGEAWAMVIGILLLIQDTLILLMLYFEMRIFLFIFVELLPSIFIRARDSIANSIAKRGK